MLAPIFAACLTILAASPVSAQEEVVSSLSFGQRTPLSDTDNSLPGFQISSQNHDVNILSDRIVLTPPFFGNTRGALWSEGTVASSDWSAELSFRASGQEQGSGNLQIWAVDSTAIGTSSIYTVGRFDGLAIVFDQYGGTGGKIRGFLNDGSKAYNAHPNLESLAFGHCDYHYRNLGRLSKLTITNHNGLAVSIDDRECFRTDKIALPAGLHFGIGAATSDNPDSFEAHSFVVRTLQSSSGSPPPATDAQPIAGSDHSAREGNWQNSRNPHLGNEDPDADPSKILDHQQQFNDLHTRLQHMDHTLASMSAVQISEEERSHHRHNEVLSVAHNRADFDKIYAKLETMERTLHQLQRDSANRPVGAAPIGAATSSITKQQIEEIAKAAKSAAPSIFSLGLTMLAVQVVIVGLFAFYTNRSRSHSKYL